MSNYSRYMKKTSNGGIRIRTTIFSGGEDGWPTMGFGPYVDKFAGITPDAAIQFAKELIALAEEVKEEKAAVKQYPEYWPPKNGDVWRNNSNVEYHVVHGKIYSGAYYIGSVQDLIDAVENSYGKYELVHREGHKLGEKRS